MKSNRQSKISLAAEVDKVKKTRSTYQRSIMKLAARISDLRADWNERCDKGKLKYYQSDLNDKLNELNASDKIIFDYLIDNAEEDAVDKKMDEIDEYKEKASTALFMIEESMGKCSIEESTPILQSSELGD